MALFGLVYILSPTRLQDATLVPPTLILSPMSLSLEEYHCDTFQLRMQFDTGEMDVERFLEAVSERGIATDADADGVREIELVFGGEEEVEVTCHAHANVRIWKDNSGRVELSYHAGTSVDGLEPPPTLADAPSWLGQFFADKPLTTHIHVNYTFDQSYEPTISLSFPLVASNKQLAGAVVTGLAFTLPTEPKTTVILQSGATNQTYLFLRRTIQTQLKEFELNMELQNLTSLVSVVIKKAE